MSEDLEATMKTEVFIRVYLENMLRLRILEACLERWWMQQDAELILLIASNSPRRPPMHYYDRDFITSKTITDPDFWRASKQMAEDMASGPIYVFADDDHLIIGENFISNGLEAMAAHPEYGLLSAWITEYGVQPRGIDEHVIPLENNSGATYFMRKGSIGQFPQCEIRGQDAANCTKLWERGWKTGFAKRCFFNHVGNHFSTENPDCWNRI